MLTGIAYAQEQGAGPAGGTAEVQGAQQGANQKPGGLEGLFASPLPMMIIIIAIFYFLLFRPQQKKAKEHQNMLSNLRKGDKVLTNGGLFGEITGLTDTVATIEIAPKIRVKVSRRHIAGLSNPSAPVQQPEKK